MLILRSGVLSQAPGRFFGKTILAANGSVTFLAIYHYSN